MYLCSHTPFLTTQHFLLSVQTPPANSLAHSSRHQLAPDGRRLNWLTAWTDAVLLLTTYYLLHIYIHTYIEAYVRKYVNSTSISAAAAVALGLLR